MNPIRNCATIVSFLVLVVSTAPAARASAREIAYPRKPGVYSKPTSHLGSYGLPYVDRNPVTKSGKWMDVKSAFPGGTGPDTSLLLTDGRVMTHSLCTNAWYFLTPDRKGRYEAGKWSASATMPSGYYPLYFASEILPDGRLIMNGGEYNHENGNCGAADWTTQGAIYDPVADSWTSVPPPKRWDMVGDAPSVILPEGSYMLADCCATYQVIAAISGTTVTWSSTGKGKADSNNEEGLTNLPDGDLLTVDANSYLGNFPNHYEIYDTANGSWSSPGETAQQLVDATTHEIGPAVLRPDGNVIYFGAVGHNDIFSTRRDAWSAGPDFPVIDGQQYACEDAPAALLTDGNVVVQASPGFFSPPSHFFEFSISRKGGALLTQVNDPNAAPGTSGTDGHFLELPTGQVLWTNDGQLNAVEVATYTPKGNPKSSWLPVVVSVATTLTVGSTGNGISGTNFNGFSQGATYGDDAQMSTNYPLVRITNNSTGDVCFGRSYDFSTMGVWTVGTTNAEFDIPKNCETGASTLQVIVNGLASAGVSVTLTT